jgi:predicted amidohydrolase YtcJ
MLGVALAELDLSEFSCATLEELYAAVARRSREVPEDGWVVGSRYDQNKLGGHPHRDRLDQAAPGRKVWLKHTSGHMCVVSSELLAEIGVLDGTANVPAGGVVATDPAGRPTGLLEEQAQRLVRDLVIPLSEEEIGQALDRACRLATSQGVTSWTDAGIGGGWIGHSPRELGAYAGARARGQLPVRTTVMVAADCLHPLRKHPDDPGDLGLDLGIRTGFGDDRLRVGAVKVFTDGSLVGRTAAMCAHYHEEPHN